MTARKAFAAFGSLLFLWAIGGCRGGYQDGIVLSDDTCDSLVHNGASYERATIPLGDWKILALPKFAQVVEDQEIDHVEIIMSKEMAMFAHPPERVSIVEARKNLGCVIQRENDTLVVATYGEHIIPGHGNMNLGLTVIVPQGTFYELRADLQGEESRGKRKDDQDPEDRWVELPTTPAPEVARAAAEEEATRK